jgi:hypothetical protein
MNKVKRYNCYIDLYDDLHEEEFEDGKYVYYSDYEKLKKENEDFKNGVQNFKCQACGHYASPFVPVYLISEIDDLKTENQNLKAQLEVIIQNAKNDCTL